MRASVDRALIAQPGVNCWRVDRAHRFYCIQDAANYYRLVREAMLRARHTVFILGWDTMANTNLLPGETCADGPTTLAPLLRHVARRSPLLQIYLLTWDYASVYAFERDPFARLRFGWRMPRNLHFSFDPRHPLGRHGLPIAAAGLALTVLPLLIAALPAAIALVLDYCPPGI